MPVEIAIPFRLDDTGRIAVESNPNAQIRQHVMSLINTEPSQRVVISDYGVPLVDALFDNDDDTVAFELAELIKGAFARWEPGVALQNVDAVPGELDGRTTVVVNWVRQDAPETHTAKNTNVATVRIGGHVDERVRG